MSEDNNTNPTLSRRLRRALLATLFAVLVLATAAAAVSAYFEASDIQDETLLSVARLVEISRVSTKNDTRILSDRNLDDSAISIWEIGGTNRHKLSIDKRLTNGFHTVRENDIFWRIYVTRTIGSNKPYVVAQKLSVSAELALQSAFNTAIPLLLLFLLIPVLTTLIVRHSFKPLNTLTNKVGTGDSLTLDLSDKAEIPVEVLPFVSAIDSLLAKNEAYNNRQRRFIADAAHELRTPITALSLEIENLRSAKSETIRRNREAGLLTSTSRLQRLLNQLLDLARAQSIGEGSKINVMFNELVKTQIADLYRLAEDKQINISVIRNEPVQVIDINNQLQHLIRNALNNAIKYTPNAGSINIELCREGRWAVFNVIDNGPGVLHQHLDKLREPFYRPDGQVSGKGSGLGLAICHEISVHLKGQITLSNVSPAGFRFSYRQPLA